MSNNITEINKAFIQNTFDHLFERHGVNNVMNNLNDHLNLDLMNEYISFRNEKIGKKYSSPTQEKSGYDSMRGKLCEEIVIYALERSLHEENREDIMIESKSKTISDNFVIRSAMNVNLLKKFDVDILLYNGSRTKFYCLSVKNSTRERIGQSETVLFMLDKEVMRVKYNSSHQLFWSPLWDKNAEIKYGMVIFDGDGKDYSRLTRKGKEKKDVTREFDVELFFQDRKFGGGFTLLNNHPNFRNTIKYSELFGKILSFFDEKK